MSGMAPDFCCSARSASSAANRSSRFSIDDDIALILIFWIKTQSLGRFARRPAAFPIASRRQQITIERSRLLHPAWEFADADVFQQETRKILPRRHTPRFSPRRHAFRG